MSTNKFLNVAGLEKVAAKINNVDAKTVKMVEVTWAELKALRDGGKLMPGMQYRITDYTCTTTQADTSSAGHVFDIVVTADDESTINKKARAALHAGDEYFANNDLAAWQLWYDIDNDQSKYAWADPVNGKGVIFRMIDEFNNDVPYDFKNIVYEERPGFTYEQWGDTKTFVRDSSLDADGYYGWRAPGTPPAWSNPYCFTTVETPTTNMTLYKDTSGSVISYGGTILSASTVSADIFTFDNDGQDSSLLKSNDVYGNIIKPNEGSLHRIIFKGTKCFRNTFGAYCRNNTFGDRCSDNTFGDNCYNNTFAASFCGNIIIGSFYRNTFGTYCENNTFGTGCADNTFGRSFTDNTFGGGCSSNIFGNSCSRNTFGDYCTENTFGSGCIGNTFGNYVEGNTFGDECYSITFGNNCSYNTFGTSSESIGYCRGIILDNKCSYLYINSTDTSASSSNYLQNVHVHLGVYGSSSSNRKTLTVPDRNLDYETEFVASGSDRIIV